MTRWQARVPDSILAVALRVREAGFRLESSVREAGPLQTLLRLSAAAPPSILAYHVQTDRVAISRTHRVLGVSLSQLLAQLSALRQRAKLRSVSGLLDAMGSGDAGGSGGSVAVAVDDVEAEQLGELIGELLKRRLAATLYVVAGSLARKSPPLRDGQLSEMRSIGIEVGSHSYRHIDLVAASDAELDVEVAQSRRLIEDSLCVECRSFSYPFGRYDARTLRVVREAGYCSALSCRTGHLEEPLQHPLELRRIEVVRWDDERSVTKKLWGSCRAAMWLWRFLQRCRDTGRGRVV